MKTDEEIGATAKEIARKKVLAQCKSVKLTTRRVLQRISEGLDAKDSKVFYDKDRGKCIVGPAMVDHSKRLEAAGLGIIIHDMKPCQKSEIKLSGTVNLADVLNAARERANAKPSD